MTDGVLPTLETRAPLPHLLPLDPHRSGRNPLRAIRRYAHWRLAPPVQGSTTYWRCRRERGVWGNGARGEEGGWYGGRELEQGEPVVICAEGEEEACAAGTLSMGTKEVKEKGKGPVVEEAHYLGRGFGG